MNIPKKTAFIVCFLLLYIQSILGFEAYLKPLIILQTPRLELSDLIIFTGDLEKDMEHPMLKTRLENHVYDPVLISLDTVIEKYIKNKPILLSGQDTIIIPHTMINEGEQIFYARLLRFIEKNNKLTGTRLTITVPKGMKPDIPGIGEIEVTGVESKNSIKNGDTNIPFGEINITYWISGNGPFYFTCNLKAEIPVGYAKEDIPYRSTLSRQNLSFKLVDISTLWDTPIFETTAFENYQTKRRIYSGKMVTTEALEVTEIVKVGDRLPVILRNGPIRIETSGYALSSGNKGNTITVRINRTGKQLQGVISKDGKIVVEIVK